MIGSRRLIAGLAALWLGRASAVAAGPVYQTSIDNAVAACLRIERRPVVVQGNLVLLPTTLTVRRSVAECGCKAAALTYRVTGRSGHQATVGDIWNLARDRTRDAFDFTFVLSSDASARAAPPFRLSLSCAAPE